MLVTHEILIPIYGKHGWWKIHVYNHVIHGRGTWFDHGLTMVEKCEACEPAANDVLVSFSVSKKGSAKFWGRDSPFWGKGKETKMQPCPWSWFNINFKHWAWLNPGSTFILNISHGMNINSCTYNGMLSIPRIKRGRGNAFWLSLTENWAHAWSCC